MSNRIKSSDFQMGKSFVLPIEQSGLTTSQVKVNKIIAEADLKVQQILNDAKVQAETIINEANAEAERISQEAEKMGQEAERIVEEAKTQAQQEYDGILKQAYQEGFTKGEQDGLDKFKTDACESLKSLETLSSASFETKKTIIDSATTDIVELINVIADKVCHRVFDDKILKDITLETINKLSDKENITIIVNPDLVNNISVLCEDFRQEIPKLQTIKILEDSSVSPDGVIIESLNTRLDSRISAQISELAEKMLTGTDNELE